MLRLYETRSRSLREIRPASPRLLKMYACGPTVYRYAHVGNLRTFLLPDLIRRTAELAGCRVLIVQNITDVGHMQDDTDVDPTGEDKLIAQARREGRSALDIARFYTDAFHRDQAALNIHPADLQPRASDNIEVMLELVGTLVERGHAYRAEDGTVYFDARSSPGYGEISGNRLDELRPGHRFGGGVDENKRFHADWALWKRSDAGRRELVWGSPWGPGFPGWHVECSAMSLHHLGHAVDVHTGGIDLRFPHHEDERAQSNAAAGTEVVHNWVHGEHLLFDGRKMSKSTGNVVLLSDVVDRGHDPLALRMVFLEHRYRQQMNLTWDDIAAADRTLARWRQRVAEWAESPSVPMRDADVQAAQAAFENDLDTPAALAVLRRVERDPDLPDGARFETFAHLDRLFGLDLAADVGKPRTAPELPHGAQELLDSRVAARAARDWATSDRLRDQLAALGVAVADTPGGQRWTLTPR